MFSKLEKQKIADVVENVLKEIDHPEMPKEKPMFTLHVYGKDVWSWADIEPNHTYDEKTPKTSDWNENAREYMEGEE